jgi:hypothetical protein
MRPASQLKKNKRLYKLHKARQEALIAGPTQSTLFNKLFGGIEY